MSRPDLALEDRYRVACEVWPDTPTVSITQRMNRTAMVSTVLALTYREADLIHVAAERIRAEKKRERPETSSPGQPKEEARP